MDTARRQFLSQSILSAAALTLPPAAKNTRSTSFSAAYSGEPIATS